MHLAQSGCLFVFVCGPYFYCGLYESGLFYSGLCFCSLSGRAGGGPFWHRYATARRRARVQNTATAGLL